MRRVTAALPLVFLGIALGLAGWIGWDVWRAADEARQSVVAVETTMGFTTTSTAATTTSTSATASTSSTALPPATTTTTALPREWLSLTVSEVGDPWCFLVGGDFEAYPCWPQAHYSVLLPPPTALDFPVDGMLGWLGNDLQGAAVVGGILIDLEWVSTPDGEALAGTFVVGQEASNLRQVTVAGGGVTGAGDFGDLIVARALLSYPAPGFDEPVVEIGECGPPLGQCENPGTRLQVPLGELVRRLEIGWAYAIRVPELDWSEWAREPGDATLAAEQSEAYLGSLLGLLAGEAVEPDEDAYIFGAQIVFPGSSWYRSGLSPGLIVGTAPGCTDCADLVEALQAAVPGLPVSQVEVGSPEAAALYLGTAPSVVVVDESHAQVGAPTTGERALEEAEAIGRLACYTLLNLCPDSTRRSFEVINTDGGAPVDTPIRRWCVNWECPVPLGLIRDDTYVLGNEGFVLSGILVEKYLLPEYGRLRDVHVGVFQVGTDQAGQPLLVHLVYSALGEHEGKLLPNWLEYESFTARADYAAAVEYLAQGDFWLPWDSQVDVNSLNHGQLLPFEAEAALQVGHQFVMELITFDCDEDYLHCQSDEIRAYARGQRSDAPMGQVAVFLAWHGALG